MYLEGIIVCVNYADFLAHTLPYNKHHFDNLVIVTDTKDEKTQWLCEYYNVRCVQTNIFYTNGEAFNKGAGICEGLKVLNKSGWVLHLDADMYLPPKTREILSNLSLDETKIYGCDRLMCPDYESWMKFIDYPNKIQEGWVYVHLNSFPIGVRLAEYQNKNSGWEPIGFFQLWNPKGSVVYDYPDKHGYADRTDVLHAKRWPREKRELLPEIVAIHLESEGLGVAQMGKNWRGRKTSIFSFGNIGSNNVVKDGNTGYLFYNKKELRVFLISFFVTLAIITCFMLLLK